MRSARDAKVTFADGKLCFILPYTLLTGSQVPTEELQKDCEGQGSDQMALHHRNELQQSRTTEGEQLSAAPEETLSNRILK